MKVRKIFAIGEDSKDGARLRRSRTEFPSKRRRLLAQPTTANSINVSGRSFPGRIMAHIQTEGRPSRWNYFPIVPYRTTREHNALQVAQIRGRRCGEVARVTTTPHAQNSVGEGDADFIGKACAAPIGAQ